MITRLSIICCAIALGLLATPPAQATTVLKVDVPALTQTSQWVVRARVHSVTNVDLRPNGTFATDIDLRISEVYRGQDAPAQYTLRLPGGRGADGMAMLIPGMPTFRAGENVVLFLEKTSVGHIPCGLGQGVFRVSTDALGNDWVQQSTSGAHYLRRDPAGRLREAAPVLHTAVRTLDDLVLEIYASQLP